MHIILIYFDALKSVCVQTISCNPSNSLPPQENRQFVQLEGLPVGQEAVEKEGERKAMPRLLFLSIPLCDPYYVFDDDCW